MNFYFTEGKKSVWKIMTSTVPATLLEREQIRKWSQKALIIPILNYMDLPNFIKSGYRILAIYRGSVFIFGPECWKNDPNTAQSAIDGLIAIKLSKHICRFIYFQIILKNLTPILTY